MPPLLQATPAWPLWAACLLLVCLRGLVAAAESALFGVSDHRAKELAKLHPRAGARVLRHKSEREAAATAIRVGMVLMGSLAAAIGALVPPKLLAQAFHSWLSPGLDIATGLAGALLVGVLSVLTDVMTRGAAIAAPERWALRLSWLVSLLVYLTYPPMRLLLGAINLFTRPFGGPFRFESPPPPLEELEKLLAAQAARNEVDKSAPQLIRSIFELSDKRCRDVMVPRTETVCIDITSAPKEILPVLAEESHSRLPVYRDDIDHILGVLHVRDLIPLLEHPELIVLEDIIRPAHFVPWMKPIGDLLRDMQQQKIHMAMVVDEYGGFMGIVTLEDILREIVGDIGDEFEVEESQIEKLADGSFLVDAGVDVADFVKTFNVPLPDGDFETLGGFLSQLSGSIPDIGDRFSHGGLQFTVFAKEGARLDRIKVQRAKTQPPPPAGRASS